MYLPTYYQLYYGAMGPQQYQVVQGQLIGPETIPLKNFGAFFPYSAPSSYPYPSLIKTPDFSPYYPPYVFPYYPETRF